MSETPTFIELCLLGTAAPEQIDEYVERWHDGELGNDLQLRDLLGMSSGEYVMWMRDASAIHAIIASRRDQSPLEHFIDDHYATSLANLTVVAGDGDTVAPFGKKLRRH